MRHNILITSVGKRVALVRYFKETLIRFFPEAKVFSADMNPEMAPAAYVSDGCFKVHRVTDESYMEQLLTLCKVHEVGMVVPTIDTELIVLTRYKEQFAEQGIWLIVSEAPFVAICRDKRRTNDFFMQRSIPIPKPIDKRHPEFPMFAKPYDGSLSTNLHYIRNAEELTPEILDDSKLIFMEYIDKKVYKEYTVDLYYGRDNLLKCAVPRERIEIRAGEINKGRTAKNSLVRFVKDHLGEIEGCVGCICIQMFYNESLFDLKGIEINPRFGGGYPLSYMAGANYPSFLIEEYFMGKEIPYTDNWKDNLLMLRYDDAIFA